MSKYEAVYERNHAMKYCLAVYPVGTIPKSSANGHVKERSTPFIVPEECLNVDGTPNLTLIQANFPAPKDSVA